MSGQDDSRGHANPTKSPDQNSFNKSGTESTAETNGRICKPDNGNDASRNGARYNSGVLSSWKTAALYANAACPPQKRTFYTC